MSFPLGSTCPQASQTCYETHFFMEKTSLRWAFLSAFWKAAQPGDLIKTLFFGSHPPSGNCLRLKISPSLQLYRFPSGALKMKTVLTAPVIGRCPSYRNSTLWLVRPPMLQEYWKDWTVHIIHSSWRDYYWILSPVAIRDGWVVWVRNISGMWFRRRHGWDVNKSSRRCHGQFGWVQYSEGIIPG